MSTRRACASAWRHSPAEARATRRDARQDHRRASRRVAENPPWRRCRQPLAHALRVHIVAQQLHQLDEARSVDSLVIADLEHRLGPRFGAGLGFSGLGFFFGARVRGRWLPRAAGTFLVALRFLVSTATSSEAPHTDTSSTSSTSAIVPLASIPNTALRVAVGPACWRFPGDRTRGRHQLQPAVAHHLGERIKALVAHSVSSRCRISPTRPPTMVPLMRIYCRSRADRGLEPVGHRACPPFSHRFRHQLDDKSSRSSPPCRPPRGARTG